MTTEPRTRSIDVGYLARVEGEGSLKVRVVDDVVEEIEFGIFEPPRFFEAFMRGRPLAEAPDITARICGICPIAYQMSSVHAMEDALDVTVGDPLRALRRLIYCGEWIESHVLHVYMLHAPDFLGFESVIDMAGEFPDAVTRGLRLKKNGNAIVSLLGGREIHPINVKVGGFYRAPTRVELERMVPELEWSLEAAIETVRWAATLPMPQIERDFEFVSLRHPDEYPFNEGRIVSSEGIDIDVGEYNEVFEERHVERSNALQSVIRDRGPYHVGPLARYNLNYELLRPLAREAAAAAGLEPECRNPFQSIMVRAVETVHACEEALSIIATYEQPDQPSVPYGPKAATGHGATEAPRGLLYHRYEVDDAGLITTAQIVPPTSQNQLTIEDDVRAVLEANLDLSDADLQWRLEQTIRNYDPCISCATHFLNLEVERTSRG